MRVRVRVLVAERERGSMVGSVKKRTKEEGREGREGMSIEQDRRIGEDLRSLLLLLACALCREICFRSIRSTLLYRTQHPSVPFCVSIKLDDVPSSSFSFPLRPSLSSLPPSLLQIGIDTERTHRENDATLKNSMKREVAFFLR